MGLLLQKFVLNLFCYFLLFQNLLSYPHPSLTQTTPKVTLIWPQNVTAKYA